MNDAVRLKLARRGFFSGGGFSGTFAPIVATVKNLALAKHVAAIYTPGGGVWKELPLTFAAHFGDHDLFSGTVNEQVTEFVLRYSALGATYFDNNGGWNYSLSSRLTVVGGNVALSHARARRGMQAGGGFVFDTSWLEGEILLNNLAYSKEVGVRLSADGGNSWFDTQANYAGEHTSSGIFVGVHGEVWRFKSPELNFNGASPTFRFAVFYRHLPTGETFWDNNLGQDFYVSKAEGSIIE
jgi:hypothetical protein